jgi:hypothetical protein
MPRCRLRTTRTYIPDEVWRANVEGTDSLLEVAAGARVRRVLVISSRPAFNRSVQMCGRVECDVKAIAGAFGGWAVRSRLMSRERSGGMAPELRKLTCFPIIPVIALGSGPHAAPDDELMATVLGLSAIETLWPLSFRADSLLGLVYTAPCVDEDGPLASPGVTVDTFALAPDVRG